MRLSRANISRLYEVVRFYQAAVVNTCFGISVYFLLVYLGLNLYLAQAISFVMGVAFNYFTYSRHAFRDYKPSVPRFLASYMLYYVASVGALAAMKWVFKSPYLAGIAATVLVSAMNFVVLKMFVFRKSLA